MSPLLASCLDKLVEAMTIAVDGQGGPIKGELTEEVSPAWQAQASPPVTGGPFDKWYLRNKPAEVDARWQQVRPVGDKHDKVYLAEQTFIGDWLNAEELAADGEDLGSRSTAFLFADYDTLEQRRTAANLGEVLELSLHIPRTGQPVSILGPGGQENLG